MDGTLTANQAKLDQQHDTASPESSLDRANPKKAMLKKLKKIMDKETQRKMMPQIIETMNKEKELIKTNQTEIQKLTMTTTEMRNSLEGFNNTFDYGRKNQ